MTTKEKNKYDHHSQKNEKTFIFALINGGIAQFPAMAGQGPEHLDLASGGSSVRVDKIMGV